MRIYPGTAKLTLILVGAARLYGQSAQASKSFEVASAKRLLQPSATVSTAGGPGTSDPGRWVRSNVTLLSLLTEAFQIQGHAIVGPDWLRSNRYEIVARVPAGASRDDIPSMLQQLITERFGLTFHREQREMPGYALVTSGGAPKLKPAAATPAPIPGRGGFPGIPEGIAPGAIKIDSVDTLRRFAAGAMSMSEFANYLAGLTNFPVTDLTQLQGKYDIILYYEKPTAIRPDAPDNGLDLMSALREQLGVELRTRKTRVDLLMIDHIEQTPVAN